MTKREELVALAGRLENHTEWFAHQPLNMTMNEWNSVSNDFLEAAKILRAQASTSPSEREAKLHEAFRAVELCDVFFKTIVFDRDKYPEAAEAKKAVRKALSSRDDGEAKSSTGLPTSSYPDINDAAHSESGPSEAPSTIPADVLAMKEACKRAVYEADYLKDALANIDAIEIDKLSPEVKADASPPDWKQDQAETTRIKPPATAEGGRDEPVAWLRTWPDGAFSFSQTEPALTKWTTVLPLYTHPASPPDVEAISPLDESAIRRDEREKCAAEVERANWPCVGDARRIASAIRTGGQK
jgi:hypothetical protein